MPQRLHPTERTICVHVKVPESLHAELLLAKKADGRALSEILREIAREWVQSRLAGKGLGADKAGRSTK